MSGSDATCWTVIRGAAEGRADDRSQFVRLYSPVVRAYLRARWRGMSLVQDVDDAMQEVFLDCFRERGVLDTVDAERPGGFRPFLYAAVRNVARHAETKQQRSKEQQPTSAIDLQQVKSREDELSTVFDRAWAVAVVQEAAARQAQAADDPEARRRVELLRLRFEEDLPIREIAKRWDTDATHLHRQYAKARKEFEDCLLEVVLFHQPGTRAAALEEVRRLLQLLG